MTERSLLECGAGRVIRVEGKSRARDRIVEMGVTKGAYVRLVRAAAFGDPVQIALRGYALTLRRSDAAGIFVDAERRNT